MDELLREAAGRPDLPGSARAGELLRTSGYAGDPGTDSTAASSPGGDELSDRELEVLRLLASDLTGPQIARQLFVSVNTLRTHTRHIFTKLDVNTRRAAIRRATDLGLL